MMQNLNYKTVHSSDIVNENGHEDFHRKYYGSYFRLASHDNMLVYLKDYENSNQLEMSETIDDGIDLIFDEVKPKSTKVRKFNTNDLVFDFTFPDLGCIFLEDATRYLSILPKQQYVRCYNDTIVTMDNLYKHPLKGGGIIGTPKKRRRAYQAFNAKYRDIEYVVDGIRNGTFVSHPIDSEYSLGITKPIEGILVYYKTLPIGRLNEGDMTVELLPHTEIFEGAIMRHPTLNLY